MISKEFNNLIDTLKLCLKRSDDLRLPKYKGRNYLVGHCYVASEAFYHLINGSENGWRPMFIMHEGNSHWFLQNGSSIIDITAKQFKSPVPYFRARGKGFLTKEPSKRAKILMERINEENN